VSQLLVEFPQIRELDINPLRVFHDGEGCTALDARVILWPGVGTSGAPKES
jgi:hypothetical protein